ncbi:Glycolipid 2-alpha-mannosyltransferase-like protein [Emericellopsis cladophorae]|uniref:Glycolipid 2-alpha-mannosyltransferase-like protein n=1 Tax=Emericellopsis cladophorae TaxID=2686198 RepID=A0A9P9XTR3_9HYPO|nr:Glycolipid 2-alpha-mannosyltransferase-like protein [Emericellopsis cladophorae]KAI6777676.1 Glycolipid 2-alpha-mannosyltransferase-like protein [Emericellopsis cladophorae]
MRDYDWFLRVEPGAQFPRPIGFDVFRFMRDNGIAYGFTESAFNYSSLETLSPQIRAFMENNPHLLHQDADLGWLLNTATRSAAAEGLPETHGENLALGIEAEYKQKCNRKCLSKDPPTDSFADAFSAWLSNLYPPSFELGSTGFLRGETARPTPTPAPLLAVDNRDTVPFDGHELAQAAMLEQHELWDQMAVDVTRHSLSPGLISGNTVVNDRTFRFSLMMGEAFVLQESGAEK